MKRICLGKIAEAHGVKGLVKILCFGENPKALEEYGPLYLSETGNDVLSLTLKNPLGKYWLAKIDGITDKTKADEIRGTEFWLPRDKLPVIEDDNEFYIEDLTGLEVQDPDGNKIGEIIAVRNFGAGDLLEIRPLNGQPYYLPFTKETVPEVCIQEGKIIVNLMNPDSGEANE